jgi:hypothetical protein
MEQHGFGYNGQPTSFLDFYPIGFAGITISPILYLMERLL